MNSLDPTSSTDLDAEQSQTDNAQTTSDCPRITNEAVDQVIADRGHVHPSSLSHGATVPMRKKGKSRLLHSLYSPRARIWQHSATRVDISTDSRAIELPPLPSISHIACWLA